MNFNATKTVQKTGNRTKVIFRGEVSEHKLKQLYGEANVYTYPEPQEDFGSRPLEAGARQILCRVEFFWTETVVNEMTGYLAKPYDLGDFAGKICKILVDENLRKKLGSSATIHIKSIFTWENMQTN